MRILLILLLVGLCLVAAKYIPHESSDINSALYRIKRSDSHDSDSNIASEERDDDSSNDNENDDNDNDSVEMKAKKEQAKLREKEEKKRQKLQEKTEKEKQRVIEESRKILEKLEKEKRKQEERKEKAERKLAERIEKEKTKFEEERRKEEHKLEKEERKLQEKLKKQLQEIIKKQTESAEDSYLETEEEDSIEIEDIWKAHVYDKYGITVTSTKLERQAALQRYLQEEMGIDANSTKSERRQAILKLIQTKLQNDSASVESFRNLLLSHVNAAQIQKLRAKLENDLEELDNQTELLKNISLPWVSVTKQNIAEKRTFLQAIAQFLSNIVPNWFSGGQPGPTSHNSDVSNTVSGSNQPMPSTAPNGVSGVESSGVSGGDSSNNEVSGGESNLSVLPSNIASGSTVNNNLSKPKGPLSSGSIYNETPVDPTDVSLTPSNAGDLTKIDSINAEQSRFGQSATNPADPNLVGDTVSLNINVHISESNVNGLPSNSPNLEESNTVNSIINTANDDVTNTPGSLRTELSSSNPSNTEKSGNSSSPNNIEPLGGIPIDGLLPNIGSLDEAVSLNAPSNSEVPSSNPSENNGGSVPVIHINNNGLLSPSNDAGISNSVAASVSTSGNSLEPSETAGSSSLNNVNGLPINTISSANVDTLNVPVSSSTGQVNPSETSLLIGSGSISNPASPISENNVSELPSRASDSTPLPKPETTLSSKPETTLSSKPDLTSSNPTSGPLKTNSVSNLENNNNVLTPAEGNELFPSVLNSNRPNQGNSLEPSDSISGSSSDNNVNFTQNVADGLTPNIGSEGITYYNLNHVDVPNSPTVSRSVQISDSPLELTLSRDGGSVNNHVPVSETNINGLPFNSLDDITTLSNLVLSSSNPSEPNGSSDTVNGNVPITQADDKGTSSHIIDTFISDPRIASHDFGASLDNPKTMNNSDSIINNFSISKVDVNKLDSKNDSVYVPGDNTLDSNITYPIEGIASHTESASSSQTESFFTTLPTGFKETSSIPSLATLPGNISEENNFVVNSSTASIGNIEINGPNTKAPSAPESSGSIRNATIVSGDSIDVTGISNINGGGEEQVHNVVLGENTEISTNADSDFVGTTLNPVSVNDISTSAQSIFLENEAIELSTASATDDINILTSFPDKTALSSSVADSSSVSKLNTDTNNISLNNFTSNMPNTSEPVTVSNVVSNDASIVNAITITGQAPENVNAEEQVDFLTTAVESNKDVTPIDIQTEQGVFGLQEVVNTPSDSVTAASIQSPTPLPNVGVEIPNEAAASIVDIKLQ